ncbi:unnamed protein product [Rotaria sp. Silwood1]|nr:unnamed protein product [Rotaria sp. Silwood1]
MQEYSLRPYLHEQNNGEVKREKSTHRETPDDDPMKKADRENEGWLSGDQFTIAETPIAHLNATPGTKE